MDPQGDARLDLRRRPHREVQARGVVGLHGRLALAADNVDARWRGQREGQRQVRVAAVVQLDHQILNAARARHGAHQLEAGDGDRPVGGREGQTSEKREHG